MRSYIPVVIALALLATRATADPPPGTALAPRPAPGPRPAAPFAGLPTGGGDEGDSCSGTVTAVGKGTFTVAAHAKRVEQYDAKGNFVQAIVTPAAPPRVFTAVGPLAEGGFLKEGVARAKYRLADVKVGDKVSFDWRRMGDVYEVHYVCIYRRPGGRVPPSPGEKPGETNPWHERANAEQDFEEKGIPLPEKYRPGPPAPPLRGP